MKKNDELFGKTQDDIFGYYDLTNNNQIANTPPDLEESTDDFKLKGINENDDQNVLINSGVLFSEYYF